MKKRREPKAPTIDDRINELKKLLDSMRERKERGYRYKMVLRKSCDVVAHTRPAHWARVLVRRG